MQGSSKYRLRILEGQEERVPKYGLAHDVRYFDYDSLCRLYGRPKVDAYFETARIERM